MKTLNKISLFWDAEKIDPKKNQKFVIERILENGDQDDFKWAMEYYGSEEIKKTVLKSNKLSRKSFHFWCQFFNFDKSQCLLKQSAPKHSAFWGRSQSAD